MKDGYFTARSRPKKRINLLEQSSITKQLKKQTFKKQQNSININSVLSLAENLYCKQSKKYFLFLCIQKFILPQQLA